MADQERRNPKVRHESSDLHAKAVSAGLVGIFLGTMVIVFGLWFYFEHLRHEFPQPESRAGVAPAFQRLSQPVLEENPSRDLTGFLESQRRALESYRWVDRQAGIVTIPIEAAMRMVATRGLPPRPAQPGLTLGIPKEAQRDPGFDDRVLMRGER